MTSNLHGNIEPPFDQTAFEALFTVDGLSQLDHDFIEHLKEQDSALSDDLLAYRDPNTTWTAPAVSDFVIRCAPYLEDFIAQLFQIDAPIHALKESILAQDPIFQFKKY